MKWLTWNADAFLIALWCALIAFVLMGTGCATLKNQATNENESVAAALLEDVGQFAKAEVQCDPAIVAQIAMAIYTLNVGLLVESIECVPVAASAVAAHVRAHQGPPPTVERAQLVKSLVVIHADLAARTKQ